MQGAQFLEDTPIVALYEWFATETSATSPTWARLCRWISRTPQIHERLDTLPGQARQPNRFLAAVRYLDGPVQPGPAFLAWFPHAWPQIERVVLTRTTQTNEPGRCAVTAPLLASLPQPVALLELGPAAGLCLIPDRYTYRFLPGGPVSRPAAAGPDVPQIVCEVSGTLPADPAELVVAARLGIDRNPLDVTDADTRRWLRALVWPGEEDREARLAQAMASAALDAPELRQGDLSQAPEQVIRTLVDELRHTAPAATPVVMHSAVLAYLDAESRGAVCAAIRSSGARWISLEGITVIEEINSRLDVLGEPPHPAAFVVALDGEPVGWSQAHGRWTRWGGASAPARPPGAPLDGRAGTMDRWRTTP